MYSLDCAHIPAGAANRTIQSGLEAYVGAALGDAAAADCTSGSAREAAQICRLSKVDRHAIVLLAHGVVLWQLAGTSFGRRQPISRGGRRREKRTKRNGASVSSWAVR